MEESVINYNLRPSYMDNGHEDPQPLGIFDVGVRKRLSDEFLDPEDPAAGGDKIKTFLRLRPASSRTAVETNSVEKVYDVEDESTLVVHLPQKRSSTADLSISRFTFSHVFGQNSSQSEIFDECVLKLVNGLFTGDCGLIFSYGATNSGKTYTMQGYGRDFGVVPRTLEYLFNRLEHCLYKKGDIKPNQFDSYLILDETNRKLVAEGKNKILRDAKIKPADISIFVDSMVRSSSSMCSSANLHEHEIIGLHPIPTPDETLLSNNSLPNAPLLYSIWVSFAEIYNERVFDLFETVQKGKKRKDLKLYQDTKGRVYINDLTECCANSAEEAYQLFLAGKQNLQFASTQMNSHSSRSHSFFNIRMVVIGRSGSHVYPKEVYRFSFCDLAGIERVSQTGNVGPRLKESGSINQSLIVLLRCIRALRDRQDGKKSSLDVIPFRDSKLARIFKSYLTTATQVSMIVNVNPDPEMLESSLFVLQNSALASSVRTHKKIEPPANNSLFCRKLRASIGFNLQGAVAEETVSSGPETEDEDEESPEKPNTIKRRPVAEPSAAVKRRHVPGPSASVKTHIAQLESENLKLQRKVKRIEDDTREQLQSQFQVLLDEQRESYETMFDKEAEFMTVLNRRRMAIVARALDGNPGILNVSCEENANTGKSTGTQTVKPQIMTTASNTISDFSIPELRQQDLQDAKKLCVDCLNKPITTASDTQTTNPGTVHTASNTDEVCVVEIDGKDSEIHEIKTELQDAEELCIQAYLEAKEPCVDCLNKPITTASDTQTTYPGTVDTASNTVEAFPGESDSRDLEIQELKQDLQEAKKLCTEYLNKPNTKVSDTQTTNPETMDTASNTFEVRAGESDSHGPQFHELKQDLEDAKKLCTVCLNKPITTASDTQTTNTQTVEVGSNTVELRDGESDEQDLKIHQMHGEHLEMEIDADCNPRESPKGIIATPKLAIEQKRTIDEWTPAKAQDGGEKEIKALKQQLQDAADLCLNYHKNLTEANVQNEKLTTDFNKLYKEKLELMEDQECLHASMDTLMVENEALEKELKDLKLKQSAAPRQHEPRVRIVAVGDALNMGQALDFVTPTPPRARRTTYYRSAKSSEPTTVSGQKRKHTTTRASTRLEGIAESQKGQALDLTSVLSSDESEADGTFIKNPKRKRVKKPKPVSVKILKGQKSTAHTQSNNKS